MACGTRATAGAPETSRPIGAVSALAAEPGAAWVAEHGDPRGAIVAYTASSLNRRLALGVGARPDGVAVGGGVVWVANDGAEESARIAGANTVDAFDARSGRRLARIAIVNPAHVVTDRLGAWVLTSRAVVRLRTRPVRVVWRHAVAREPQALATDGRSVWVSTFAAGNRPEGAVYRFGARTGRLESVRPMSLVLTMLAARRGVLWGVGSGAGPIVRIARNGVHRVAGIVRPSAVAATPTAIWVAAGSGDLYRMREDGTVAARRKVASSATLLAAAGRTVWVFDAAAGRLVAVDTRAFSP